MAFTKTIPAILLLLMVASCYTLRPVARMRNGQNIRIDSSITADTGVVRLMRRYRDTLNAAMHTVIGRTAVPLTKAQPECTLGNFVADAMLTAAKSRDPSVVAAVINYSALRVSYIAPGPVQLGDLYRLMPFDDPIVFIDIPGKTLLRLCNHIAAAGGWPVSGLQFRIHQQQAEAVLLNGRPVNRQLVYRIAVPAYLAGGGHRCNFLKTCPKKKTKYFGTSRINSLSRAAFGRRPAIKARNP